MDEAAPPPPPPPYLEAAFIIEGTRYYKDIKAPFTSGSKTWVFNVSAGLAGGTLICLSWDISGLPTSFTATLTDTLAGTDTDMGGATQYCYNTGSSLETRQFEITINAENIPPNANAGPDQTTKVNDPVTLDGSGSDDGGDGPGPLLYKWEVITNQSGGSLESGAGNFSAGNVTVQYTCGSTPGTDTIQLSVDDQGTTNNTDTDIVKVTCTANQPPVADADGPYSCDHGDVIHLDGTGSNDPDGTITSYYWDYDNDGQYNDATGSTPSYTCSCPDADETFPIGLQVTDDDGAQDSVSTNVNCTAPPPPQPPVADADGPYSAYLNGTVVLDGTGSYDPNGDPLSYEWTVTENPSGGSFESGTNTASPVYRCGGTEATDTVQLEVSDGSLTDTDTATIQCTALPEGTLFFEDFEGGIADWSYSPQGLWHLADDTACASPGYSSASHSFYYGQESSCDYNTGSRTLGRLISPAIAIPEGTAQLTLSFDYLRQVEGYAGGSYDKTSVEVSFDGGPWSQVWYKDSKDPSAATWLSSGAIPLSVPDGASSLLIRFVFDSVDRMNNNFLGWLIDDILVSSGLADTTPPAQVTDFEASDGEDGQSTLTWTNPSDSDLAEVIVRRKEGGYPSNHEDGVEACRFTDPNPGAAGDFEGQFQTCTDTRLTNETTYYYAVFGRDTSGNWNDAVAEGQNADTGTPQGGGVTIFFENFEGTTWTLTGLWHIVDESYMTKNSCTPSPLSFPSSSHAAWYGDNGTAGTCDYNTGKSTKGSLTSAAISVSGLDKVTLSFMYFRQVESYAKGGYDKTYVEVSFDNGSWTQVWSEDSKDPSAATWQSSRDISVDVPSGASSMRIRFVFDSVDRLHNGFLGWLIDDVKVRASAAAALAIGACPPAGTVDTAYSYTMTATGGAQPYTWSATGLPAGLSIDPNTGKISGTPTTVGDYNVMFTVTDSADATDEKSCAMTINPPGLFEDWEAGLNGWTATGLWHVTDEGYMDGQPCAPDTTPFPSSNHAAWYGDTAEAGSCNYKTGSRTSGTLTSPAITVPGDAAKAILNFQFFRKVEYFTGGTFDKAYVQVSFNGGTTWTQVWSKDSKDPSAAAWTSSGDISINVPAGATSMLVRFGFDSGDKYYNDYLGWLIDDVSVTFQSGAAGAELEPKASPLAVSAVTNFPNPISGNGTTFTVEGSGIRGIAVQVFNLTGVKVFDSGFVHGNQLDWHLQSDEGFIVANGVYLYVVTVRGWDGSIIRSEVRKLIILR